MDTRAPVNIYVRFHVIHDFKSNDVLNYVIIIKSRPMIFLNYLIIIHDVTTSNYILDYVMILKSDT